MLALEAIYGEGYTKYKCLCDCGEETTVALSALLNGQQMCGKCKAKLTSEINRKDYTGLISESGVLFLYPLYNKDYNWYWRCRCGHCGREFDAIATNVWIGNISSCGCIKSASEEIIRNILAKHNITFQREVSFEDCVNVAKLRFDFGIYHNNDLLGLIEYDGQQHYIPVAHWGGEETLAETQKRDQIKNSYCAANDIPLLRIPYFESKDNLENIIITYCRELFIRNDCSGVDGNIYSPATPYSYKDKRDEIQSELAQ